MIFWSAHQNHAVMNGNLTRACSSSVYKQNPWTLPETLHHLQDFLPVHSLPAFQDQLCPILPAYCSAGFLHFWHNCCTSYDRSAAYIYTDNVTDQYHPPFSQKQLQLYRSMNSLLCREISVQSARMHIRSAAGLPQPLWNPTFIKEAQSASFTDYLFCCGVQISYGRHILYMNPLTDSRYI